jgi:diadenosine tetraphosphatase ApaH/serine/threonine PP2A family protein phosphatase
VTFVNCGSVGKPKDGDPRGAFAVIEADNGRLDVSIRRVEYDARGVAEEMVGAGLPRELAARLIDAA